MTTDAALTEATAGVGRGPEGVIPPPAEDPYGPGFWAQKLEDMLFMNPAIPTDQLTDTEKDQVATLSKNMIDIAGYYDVGYRFGTAPDERYWAMDSRAAITGVAQNVLENTYATREDPNANTIWTNMRTQINRFANVGPGPFEVGPPIVEELSTVEKLEDFITPSLPLGEGEKWENILARLSATTGIPMAELAGQIQNLWLMKDAGAPIQFWEDAEGLSKEAWEIWAVAQTVPALMEELKTQFSPPSLRKTDQTFALRAMLAEMLPLWDPERFSSDPTDVKKYDNMHTVYRELTTDKYFGGLMLMFEGSDMAFLEFIETNDVMNYVMDAVVPSAFEAAPVGDPLTRADKVRKKLRDIVGKKMNLGVLELQTAPVEAAVDELIDEWLFVVESGDYTFTEKEYIEGFDQWVNRASAADLVEEHRVKINAEREALVPFESAFGDLVVGVPQNQKRMLIQAYLQSYEDWYVAKNVDGYAGDWNQFVKDSDYAYGAWQQLQAIEQAKAIVFMQSGEEGLRRENFDEWFTALESAVVKEPTFRPPGETKEYTADEWQTEQEDRGGFLRKMWEDIQSDFAVMKGERSFRLNTYLTESAFFPAEARYLGQFAGQIWDDYEKQYPLSNLLGRYATWDTFQQWNQAKPEARAQWKPFQEYLKEQDREMFATMLPVQEQRNIWRLPQQ